MKINLNTHVINWKPKPNYRVEVGSRVACELAENEWYLGNVTQITSRKITVLLDDNSEIEVTGNHIEHVYLCGPRKKSKKKLTHKDIYMDIALNYEGNPKDDIYQGPNPEVMRKILKSMNVKDWQKDRHNLKGRNSLLKRYFNSFNKDFFNSQLQMPSIYSAPEMVSPDNTMITFGFWFPKDNIIFIYDEMFNRTSPHRLGVTLLHEMCHQAVTEINKKNEKDSHGPAWKKWMVKIGIMKINNYFSKLPFVHLGLDFLDEPIVKGK